MSRETWAARVARWVPRWWDGEAGPAGSALDAGLFPVEWMYRGAIGARNLAYDRGWRPTRRAAIPVVSIGNLAVGGSGKTPVAAWVARHLADRQFHPAIVLRGYGADEVMVHGELNPDVPVFADPNRASAVDAAAAGGCDVAVLDDAFQHRSLARDLDVVLVAAERWHPRARLLPRGPWREPARSARRADFVVVTRKSVAREVADEVIQAFGREAPGVPTVSFSLQPDDLVELHGPGRRPLDWLAGRRVLAVAALASPTPFVANLVASGARVELAAFRDHHEFTREDAAALGRRAAGRPLVMTLKDAVKLRRQTDLGVSAWVLHQRVEPEAGAERFVAALHELTAKGRER